MGSFTGQGSRPSSASGWIKLALLGVIVSILFQAALCEVEPTESQCRPYIEKALKKQHDLDERTLDEATGEELLNEQDENHPTDELTDSTEGSIPKDVESEEGKDDAAEVDDDDGEERDGKTEEDGNADTDEQDEKEAESMEKDGVEQESEEGEEEAEVGKDENDIKENTAEQDEDDNQDQDKDEDVTNEGDDDETKEKDNEDTKEEQESEDKEDRDTKEDTTAEKDEGEENDGDSDLEHPIEIEVQEVHFDEDEEVKKEDKVEETKEDKTEEKDGEDESKVEEDDDKPEEKGEADEDETVEKEDEDKTEEKDGDDEDQTEGKKNDDEDKTDEDDDKTIGKDDGEDEGKTEEDDKTAEAESVEETTEDKEQEKNESKQDDKQGEDEDKTESKEEVIIKGRTVKRELKDSEAEETAESEDAESKEQEGEQESPEEEELIKEVDIPENLRPRDHINKILKLDEDSKLETILEKTIDSTLKSLKNLYDTAIKPLEMLYKYRDLSNRHFGDPEIFSKPLILFMGPWSGGKSSTINYLLDNEFSHTSLRTGAEPSPAYFNILMYGEEEILDGTQLAADWTFSGLQKFGQSLLDRLRGVKLPNKLLEKLNIVEIPGILEIRKQVQRLFPFNDACQWFIDRADIIFLVYDPSKLDVGPETEAILDQLKGREYQTRIILNKADQVKPEELMRVQGTLIWNISPLMSSSEPPIMYSTSLWSMPYEAGAPTRLLLAQERAFLRDLREAIDKRVENKIASARRFAVRVRNHAKMVDCYLTTYYNHKSFFGNKKKISDDIIEYPQKYHIYEGLSTLTNISRYDLPDPDVYRDFFKINPLYDFQKLSDTCTYFRGCPINQLDVAIAYDLPELVGKYKKAVENAKEQLQKENS